ncbi:DsbA family protein [Aliigemmobacter aestuarii]|uniref:DsbA family protein n=1 Tax=Aliigemmobacter aestuarii TaxID=1445661 RepID=A0A4S3MPH0_9RHOB|nr:DsbA family protein [Gemmobacter aestuarii]THD83853.1 DsbA family protein [Gemmobacter aestuarii]
MNAKLGIGALALALIAGFGLWSTTRAPEAAGTSLLPTMAANAQEAPAAGEAIEIKDMALGSPDAKVKIIEYASYTCPHCATFHEAVFKPLKADYIDTGKVHFTFREVYFDRYGLWAAMVARCGGDMRYFGISGLLMEKQSEWAATDDPLVAVENIKTIGRTAGMDDATLGACMENGAMAQAMVTTSQANMEADGIQGTPTLMINGVKHSNMSYADLKAIIEEELAK